MSSYQHQDRIDELWDRAKDLPAQERAWFLDHACRNDPPEVRRRVEKLLDADPGPTGAPRIVSATEGHVSQTELPTIPGYAVESELGRGGMGVVYKCRNDATNRVVALKLMLRGRGARWEEVARFRVEAEALACLDHDNIARVTDVGVVDGSPYIVTEYAANGSIRDYVSTNPVSIEWCVEAVRQAAQGVHHANSRAMTHRDIKPSNMLLMENETVKITDFGLVKFTARIRKVANSSRFSHFGYSFAEFDRLLNRFADELAAQYRPLGDQPRAALQSLCIACVERTQLNMHSLDSAALEQFLHAVSHEANAYLTEPSIAPSLDNLTCAGTILGSPEFMAPEQATRDYEAIGPRTDVYGLGATLYWLLTGAAVVTGRDLVDVLRRIPKENPKPMQELNSSVPDAVDCVVQKALQKDPCRRYGDCKTLAEELDKCLDGRQPEAQMSRDRRRGNRDPKYTTLFVDTFPRKRDVT